LVLVLLWLLGPTPYAALPQQGLEGGLADVVALGEHVCGGAGPKTLYKRGQLLLGQPVTQAASWGYGWAGGLNGVRWLTTLGCFVMFVQVGAEGGVQGESSHPDRR
jgi:hypothetical protein